MAASFIVGKNAGGATQTVRTFGSAATGDLGVQTADSGATGSSVPTIASLVGGTDAGTLRAFSVTSGGYLNTFQPTLAILDTGNSSTSPLAGNGTFTGTWVDTLGYASISYSIQSDVISAVGGIVQQWSQNASDIMAWTGDSLAADRIGAGKGTDMTVRCHARYFRLVYTNGASPQSFFRLQTILNKYITSGDTMGVDHVPVSGNDALLVKSVIAGKTTAGGGSYVDVKVNPSGALQFAGGTTPSDAFANPNDAVNAASFNMGWNGASWDRLTSTTANGLDVDVTRVQGTVAVTGTFWQATQPVSGTVSANQSGTWNITNISGTVSLPTGAATETTLAAISTKTPALGQALMASSTPVVIASNQSAVPVSGTFWQATQPVSGTVAATQSGTWNISTVTSITNSVAVTGTFWQATQPVSGTVTANIGTTNGLALDATLTGGTQKAIVRGGAKGATAAADVTSTANGADHQALDVYVNNASIPVTGTFWQATQPVSGTVAATQSGTWNIATLTSITNSVAVTGTFWQATQPVSIAGTVTVAGSGNFTVTQATASNLNALVIGNKTPSDAFANPTDAQDTMGFNMGWNGATWDRLKSTTANGLQVDVTRVQGSVAVTGTFWQATQPVSGTVTANIGTTNGLALDATLTGGTQKAIVRGGAKGTTSAADVTSTANGANNQALDVWINNASVAVTGTFWQATQPVSGTVAATQSGTWNITNISGTVSLPTGAATETTLSAMSGKLPATLGQKAMAASMSVALASDQTAIPVSQSGTWNVGTVSTVTSITNAVTVAQGTAANLNATVVGNKTPADAFANPTDAQDTLAFNMGWNGTTWDRLKSTTANGLQVDVTRVQGSVAVTGTFWQATQPVSGTVTANIGTTNGLALDATLTGGTQKAINRGGAKGATTAADITSTANGADHQALDVWINNASVAVTGTFWQATQPVSGTVAATQSGTWNVATLTSITNAVTVSQSTASSLNATVVGNKTPSDAFANPTDAQDVAGFMMGFNGTTWDRVRVANTGRLQVDVVTGGGSNASVGSTGSAVPASATYSGMNVGGNLVGLTGTGTALNVNIAASGATVPVSGTFWQATQPVSGTVAATQSGTWNITNISGTVSLPTGAATETTLAAISTKTPALGQALMASSTPVVIASNQSAVPVSGTFWQATQPVSGTVAATQSGTWNIATLTSITNSVAVTGTFWQATQPVSIAATVTVQGNKTPSDAFANPTDAQDTMGFNMGWNGTTWDRLKSTTANGLQVDVTRVQGSVAVTGTFWQATQPVSGTVAATQSGTWNITNISGTVSLPTGAATETTLAALNTKTPALGQAAMAASVPVVIANNQSAVPVSGTFWQATQPVSGTVSAAQSGTWNIGTLTSITNSVAVTGTFWQTTQPVSIAARVVTTQQAATPAVTQVTSSATSVTLKASNANRLGLTVMNDSTAILYLKMGATASSTSYTIKMAAGSYYEMPYGYTGVVDGIWASANGFAYVTEITN